MKNSSSNFFGIDFGTTNSATVGISSYKTEKRRFYTEMMSSVLCHQS